MGLGLLLSSDSYPCQQPGCAPAETYRNGPPVNVNVTVAPPLAPNLPNPNPANWKILEHWWCNNATGNSFLVVKLQYPDCTNYEGVKILVYHNIDLPKLLEQKLVDPHFSNKPDWLSPVARFEPTQRGWDMAQKFCRVMLGK